MPRFSQYLRSYIIGSPTSRISSILRGFEFGGESEITNFELHFAIYEHIAQFEVPMDNVGSVQIFDSIYKLQSVTTDLELS